MSWKDRVIRRVKGGEVGEVAVFPVEAGVGIQVGVRGVSVEAKRRHRTQALDMYRVAHRDQFRDHLSSHAVYRQIVWTQNLPIDELGVGTLLRFPSDLLSNFFYDLVYHVYTNMPNFR